MNQLHGSRPSCRSGISVSPLCNAAFLPIISSIRILALGYAAVADSANHEAGALLKVPRPGKDFFSRQETNILFTESDCKSENGADLFPQHQRIVAAKLVQRNPTTKFAFRDSRQRSARRRSFGAEDEGFGGSSGTSKSAYSTNTGVMNGLS